MVTIQAIGVFGMEELREAVHVELWGLEGEEEEEDGDNSRGTNWSQLQISLCFEKCFNFASVPLFCCRLS